MVLCFVPAHSNKVGVSVSKKIGKSVVRNLVKRRINAQFSTRIPLIKGSFNYVVVAKEKIREATFEQIGECLDMLLRKAGHLENV